MPGDTGGVGGAIRSAVPGVSGPWSSPLFGCFDDIGICEYLLRFSGTLLDDLDCGLGCNLLCISFVLKLQPIPYQIRNYVQIVHYCFF